MRRGEITGNFFDITKADIGMPFRSVTVSKKNERRNISVMDDVLDPDIQQESSTSFEYYDPSSTSFARDATAQISVSRDTIDPRLEFDRERINYNQSKKSGMDGRRINDIDMDTNMRNPKLRQRQTDRFSDGSLQNISSYNTDYINNISFNIYNEIARKTCVNFCTFPIGIMATLVENDQNIKKIMSIINTNEIFHQLRIQHANQIITSRASIILNIQPSKVTSVFSHYEDNENHIVEIPMNNPSFAVGFLCNKNGNEICFTQKLFSEYVMNLKRSSVNVYCPSFKITNKLGLNHILSSMGYINNNDIAYAQTIYFESQNNIYIRKTSIRDPVDLSDNFIFYIRYIPNNIVLFIGRHGEL